MSVASLGEVMFNNCYKGKRVLVTGHTGFKGSWLTTWLLKLGADVYGLSNNIPTTPSMFEALGLESEIKHYVADVRNFDAVLDVVNEVKPDFIFHLAAQPIVSVSYREPVETISTNVLGTANVLEALRQYNMPCCVVIITSDKCYDNIECVWGYREDDALGGKDIYSGSKAAAEMIIKSYFHSYFSGSDSKIRIAVGRAGNVIGGGDWAKDRIIVDCIGSWSKGEPVVIRSPLATRPWQHVLEPLSGYLLLAQNLAEKLDSFHCESFNFGPKAEQIKTVEQLISDLAFYWQDDFAEGKCFEVINKHLFHEAGLLKLCIDKAMHKLSWQPTLTYEQLIEFVGDWYKKYYQGAQDMLVCTNEQISFFENNFSLLAK